VTQEDAALSKDVKIIGIAIGNDKTQVDAFKKGAKASFPILSDDTLAIGAAVEVPGTPTMIMVSNSGRILYSHVGVIKDFDALLKEMRGILKTQ
jgi:hypothetical protein